MSEKLFIPVLLGTNREGRHSEKVARLVLGEMEKHAEIKTQLFDVRDFKLPDDDYGQALKDQFPEYRDAIIAADGLVIVSPEYNHGYPGRLKDVLDLLLREYVHKAVGLVGVSAQVWGGVRVIESLVPVVRELGLAVTFTDLNFPKVQNAFDEEGKPVDTGVFERIDGFLTELIWMAKTLKWGRENISSKYHEQ